MEKITLKLYEVYGLQSELLGLANNETGEKVRLGLLDEKLSLVSKYWLTNLLTEVNEKVDSSDKLKEELFKKYGEEDDKGRISIPKQIEVEEGKGTKKSTKIIPNPQLEAFNTEFSELLQEEVVLSHHKFSLDEFKDISSTSNYGTFYKLITPPSE